MMFRSNWILVAVATFIAAGFYLWLGRPGLPDQPFSERAAEISAKPATELSPAEMLTRLQQVAQQRPDLAEPHYHIGILLRAQGRGDDAIRAFQSALRRDDRHVPSLTALADILVTRAQGDVSATAAQLYDRAWRLDPQQVRAGFLSAIPDYREGREVEARARWDAVEAALPADDPKQGMIAAMVASVSESENMPTPAGD